ncbi:MAG: hypothetical protein EHM55_17890 [Acidobacteria bacterium]|nr:MAG: hypothetical protein EHM55_17890 [Acidobacteriota bacterium]
MANDLRYALRGLLRAPGFTMAAIITLAIGIGANTAIVSVIDAALVAPLPFREADRLVTLRCVTHRLSGRNVPAHDPTGRCRTSYRRWFAVTVAFVA